MVMLLGLGIMHLMPSQGWGGEAASVPSLLNEAQRKVIVIESLHDRLNTSNEEKTQLNKDLKATQQQLRVLQAQRLKDKNNIEQLRLERQSILTQITDAKQKNVALTIKLEGFEKEMGGQEQKVQTQLKQVGGAYVQQFKFMETDLKKSREQAAQQAVVIKELDQKIVDLESALQEVRRDQEVALQEKKELEQRYRNAHEESQGMLDAGQHRLEQKLADMQQKQRQLSLDLQEKMDEIEDLKNVNKLRSVSISQLRLKKSALEEENVVLMDEIKALSKKDFQGVLGELKAAQGGNAQLKQSLIDYKKSHNETLRQTKESYENKFSDLKNEMDRQRQQLKDKNREINQVLDAQRALERSLVQITASEAALQKKWEAAQSAQHKDERVTGEARILKRELSDARQQLKALAQSQKTWQMEKEDLLHAGRQADQTIRSLQKSLDVKAMEIEDIRQQKLLTEKHLKNAHAVVQDDRENSLIDLNTEVRQLTKRLDAARHESGLLQERMMASRQKEAAQELALKEVEVQNDVLLKEVRALQEDKATLNARLLARETPGVAETENLIVLLNKEILGLRKDLQKEEDAGKSFRARFDVMEEGNAQQKARLKKEAKERKRLAKKVQRLDARLAEAKIVLEQELAKAALAYQKDLKQEIKRYQDQLTLASSVAQKDAVLKEERDQQWQTQLLEAQQTIERQAAKIRNYAEDQKDVVETREALRQERDRLQKQVDFLYETVSSTKVAMLEEVQQVKEPLSREIEQLRETIKAKDKAYEELVALNPGDRMAQQQVSLRKDLKDVQTVADKKTALVEKLTRDNRQLKERVDLMNQTNAQLSHQVGLMEGQSANKQEVSALVEAAKIPLKGEISDLKKKLMLLESSLLTEKNAVQETLNLSIMQLNKDLEVKDRELTRVNDELLEAQKQQEEMEVALEEVRVQADVEVKDLTQQLKMAKKERVKQLRLAREQSQQEVEALKQNLKQLRKVLPEADEVKRSQEKIEALESRLQDQEVEAAQLNKNYKEVSRHLDMWRNKKESADKTIGRLEKEMGQLKSEFVQKFKKVRQPLEAEIAKYKRLLSKRTLVEKSDEGQDQRLTQELEVAHEALQKAQDELQRYKGQAQQLTQENKKLSLEVARRMEVMERENMQDDQEALKVSLQALKDKEARTREDLNQLRTSNSDLRDALNAALQAKETVQKEVQRLLDLQVQQKDQSDTEASLRKRIDDLNGKLSEAKGALREQTTLTAAATQGHRQEVKVSQKVLKENEKLQQRVDRLTDQVRNLQDIVPLKVEEARKPLEVKLTKLAGAQVKMEAEYEARLEVQAQEDRRQVEVLEEKLKGSQKILDDKVHVFKKAQADYQEIEKEMMISRVKNRALLDDLKASQQEFFDYKNSVLDQKEKTQQEHQKVLASLRRRLVQQDKVLRERQADKQALQQKQAELVASLEVLAQAKRDVAKLQEQFSEQKIRLEVQYAEEEQAQAQSIARLNERQKMLERLQQDYNNLQKQSDVLRQDKKALGDVVEELRLKIQEDRQEHAQALEKVVLPLNSEVAALQEQLALQKKEARLSLDQAVGALEQRLALRKAEVRTQDKALAQAQKQQEQLENSIKDLREDKNQLEAKIAQLIEEGKAAKAHWQDDVKTVQATLTKEIAQVRAEAKQQEDLQRRSHEDVSKDLQNKLAVKSKKLLAQAVVMEGLNKTNATLAEDLRGLEQEHQALTVRWAQAIDALKVAEESLPQTVAQATSPLNAKIRRLEENLERQEQEALLRIQEARASLMETIAQQKDALAASAQKTKGLGQSIEALENQKAEMYRNFNELVATHNEAKEELTRLEQTLVKNRQQHEAEMAQLKSTHRDGVKQFRINTEEMQRDLQSRQARILELDKARGDLQDKWRQSQEKEQQLQTQLTALEQDVAQVRQLRQEEERVHQVALGALQKRHQKVLSDQQDLEATTVTLQATIDTLTEDLRRVQQHKEVAVKEVQQLNEAQVQSEKVLLGLQQDQERSQIVVAEIQEVLREAQAALKVKQGKIIQVEGDKQRLQKSLAQQRKDAEALKGSVATTQEALKGLKASLPQRLAEARAPLEGQVQELEEAIVLLRGQLSDGELALAQAQKDENRQAQALARAINERDEGKRALVQQAAQADQQLQRLRVTHQQAQEVFEEKLEDQIRARETLQQQVKERDNALVNVEKERNAINEGLRKSDIKIEVLENKIVQLVAELKEMKAALPQEVVKAKSPLLEKIEVLKNALAQTKDQERQLQQEARQVARAFNALQTELEASQQQRGQLERQQAQWQAALVKAQEAVPVAVAAAEQPLRKTVEQLEQQLVKSQEEIQSLTATRDDKSAQIKAVSKAQAQTKEELARAEKSFAQVQEKNETLRLSLEEVKTQFAARLTQLKDSLTGELRQWKLAAEEADERAAQLEKVAVQQDKVVANFKNILLQKDANTTALEEALTKIRNELTLQNQSLPQALAKATQPLEQELVESKSNLKTAHGLVARYRQEIEDLQSAQRDFEAQQEKHVQARARLESQLTQVQQELVERGTRNSAVLQAAQAPLKARIKELQEMLENKDTEWRAHIEQANADISTKWAGQEQALKQAQASVKEQEALALQWQQTAVDLEEALKMARQENQEGQGSLQVLRQEIKTLTNGVPAQVAAVKESFTRDVVALRDQLSKAKQEGVMQAKQVGALQKQTKAFKQVEKKLTQQRDALQNEAVLLKEELEQLKVQLPQELRMVKEEGATQLTALQKKLETQEIQLKQEKRTQQEAVATLDALRKDLQASRQEEVKLKQRLNQAEEQLQSIDTALPEKLVSLRKTTAAKLNALNEQWQGAQEALARKEQELSQVQRQGQQELEASEAALKEEREEVVDLKKALETLEKSIPLQIAQAKASVENDLIDVDDQAKRLRQEVSKKDKELKRVQESYDALHEQWQEVKTRTTALEKELAQSKAQAPEDSGDILTQIDQATLPLQTSLRFLEKRLLEVENTLTQKEAQVIALQQEKESFTNEFKKAQAQVVDSQQKALAAVKQLAAQESQLKLVRDELTFEKNKVVSFKKQGKQRPASTTVKALQTEVNSARDALKSQERLVKELETAKEELDKTVLALLAQNNKLKKEVDDLVQGDVQESAVKAAAQDSAARQQMTLLKAQEEKVQRITAERDALLAHVKEVELGQSKIKKELTQWQAEAEKHQRLFEEASANLEENDLVFNEVVRERKGLSQELTDAEKERVTLVNKMAALKSTTEEKLVKIKGALEKRIERLEEELEATNVASKNEMEVVKGELQEKVRSLEDLLEASRDSLKSKERALQGLTQEKKTLNKALDQLRQDKASLEEALNNLNNKLDSTRLDFEMQNIFSKEKAQEHRASGEETWSRLLAYSN